MKLFAIYIGGEMKGANIELHDMRFVMAPSLIEAYPELKRQWWGIPKSLHIDCWAEITHADGYDVRLDDQPFAGPERLYFVNMGGYDRSEFLEKHKHAFVVAPSVADAKSRAIELAKGWVAPHRDEMYEAEQAFCLDRVGVDQRLYIHLARCQAIKPFEFTCDYTPIGRIAPRI